MRYNLENFKKLCLENELTVIGNCDGSIKRDTKIKGECKKDNCKNFFEKSYRQLYEKKTFLCEIHTEEERQKKIRRTCLKKYGTENSMQNKNVKEKLRKTCLEKYGTENPFQNGDIKKKIKDTCLEKYGVENPSQSEEVKERWRNTCLEKFGVEHPSQNEEIKQQKKETCLEKFGVENPFQNKDVKQKIKETCLEKFGVEHPYQNEEVRQKGKEACLIRYGVENPFQNEELKQKGRETCLEKYGTENPMQNEDVKQKSRATSLKKYGVEHPSQNPSIAEKSSKNAYLTKDFTTPSGKILKYQGYEHYALKELFEKYPEDDIIFGCTNVPNIPYRDEEKNRYHTPDIFIKSENRIIEVKSTWTLEKKVDCVFLKQDAGKALGYSYEIWVYDGKGGKSVIY